LFRAGSEGAEKGAEEGGMSSFKKILRRVWSAESPARYVPRATAPGVSLAWEVWDRKEKRFLAEDEIRTIDTDEMHYDG
jgi:hypothetical protein